MIRSSVTDPLRIDAAAGAGAIGLTFCPGKQAGGLDEITWRRDLEAETHGHPTGIAAAEAWAELLRDVTLGAPLEVAAEATLGRQTTRAGGGETARAIAAALAAPRDGTATTVERLGGGWTAEEALATDTLEDGLRCAVTHSGYSESTGAIAGGLLGLLHPHATKACPPA